MIDRREKFLEDYKKKQQEQQEKMLSENSELISDFRIHCKNLGLDLKDENFKFFSKIGIIAEYPNLLFHLNSDIIKDKEGLVNFKLLYNFFENKKFASGYLYSKNYAAMAHNFFRRGYNECNHFSPSFIEIYWNYHNSESDKFVALDFNKVQIKNSEFLEFDTWYGAKFQNDIKNIEDGVVKLRPPLGLESSDIDILFNDIHSLDIKWHTKGSIKVFQSKEFKTDIIKIIDGEDEFFPAKYIHAEFDMNLDEFRHFDGAIHMYTKNEYCQRRDSDFNYNDKNKSHIKARSIKLFKLNGSLQVKDWVELTSHFLAKNPLIYEYFEGKLPDYYINSIQNIRKLKK